MEGKNWDEFEKYKCKLENACNKLLISLKRNICGRKNQKTNKTT